MSPGRSSTDEMLDFKEADHTERPWLKQDTQSGANQETDTNTGLDDATGLQAFLTPKGVLDFGSGIVYGTDLVKNTTYLDKCVNNLHYDFINKGLIVYNKTVALDPFPALYSIYDILYSVHPIVVNCK